MIVLSAYYYNNYNWPLHYRLLFFLPYSILQTSYPNCSGYHGTGLFKQDIGREEEFTDFHISSRVFMLAKPISPSYQCLVHTTLQLKTTGIHNTCIISIISPHSYSSLKNYIVSNNKRAKISKDTVFHTLDSLSSSLVRSFCYMYMYMSCHVMAVVKFNVEG